MEQLRQHATPTWIEIKPGFQIPKEANCEVYAEYASVIRYLTPCLKKLLEAAYRARAYGFQLCPDTLFSDGIVALLLKYAQAGYHLVLCPALRQTEEAVLDDLLKHGLLPEGERLSTTGQALIIPPRVMADLFVRHLHPEMWIFEEDGHPLPSNSPFRYWRIPHGRGIILHTFYGGPILMDFEVVSDKHSECLEGGAFEDVYYNENFADCKIHVIQDSDETCMVSLTPEKVNFSQAMTGESPPRWLQRYIQLSNIRESMWHHAGRKADVMRRDLFRMPIRFHTGNLDEVWEKEERRIDRLIYYAVGDYYSISRPPHIGCFPTKFSLDPRILLNITPTVMGVVKLRIIDPVARFIDAVVNVVRIIGKRVGLALCGDKVALRWWAWRLRKLKSDLMSRPFQEPRPPAP